MGQSCTIGGIYASNNINKFKKTLEFPVTVGGSENNGKSKLTTQFLFHLLFGSRSAFLGALYCGLKLSSEFPAWF